MTNGQPRVTSKPVSAWGLIMMLSDELNDKLKQQSKNGSPRCHF